MVNLPFELLTDFNRSIKDQVFFTMFYCAAADLTKVTKRAIMLLSNSGRKLKVNGYFVDFHIC